MDIYLFPLAVAILLLIVGGGLAFFVLKEKGDAGKKESDLAKLIEEGLNVFNKKIIWSVLQVFCYLIAIVLIFSFFYKKDYYWLQLFSFLTGGLLMCFASVLVLKLAPLMLLKILDKSKAFAADSVKRIYICSNILGYLIVGLVFLGLVLNALLFDAYSVIGYGLGIMVTAFFLRIGGGIFKAATDITVDNIEKIEKQIPAFDRRNPATLLQMIGEYIGKVVGFSSDILSSFMFAIIVCVLFSRAWLQSGFINLYIADKLVQFPLYIVSLGLLAYLVVFLVSLLRIKRNFHNFLLEGIYVMVVFCGVGTYFIMRFLEINKAGYFLAYIVGLIGAVVISFTSEYLTTFKFKPVKKIAAQVEYGTAITLFNVFAKGLKNNVIFVVYMLVIILASVLVSLFDFYGLAITAIGMLTAISGIVVANMFAPLASTANKVAMLAEASETVINNTKKAVQVSKTTIALGNGFATGVSFMITFSMCLALFMLAGVSGNISGGFFVGAILGLCVVFLFSGFLLSGLVKTILKTMEEVARQFKEIPYLYEDKARPDVTKASLVVAINAMNSLIIPAIVMVLVPILLGYVFGKEMLLGLVLGVFIAALGKAYYWTSIGDSLSNTRYYIDEGNYGGKESPTYKNIVDAENFGDAFKDMLAPGINILIRAVSIIAMFVMILVI